MYKYVIDGHPIPWKRVGGTTMRYDLQKHEKLALGIALGKQHKGLLFTVPLKLDLSFFVKHPQVSKAKEIKVMGTYCISRPDLDNYIKFFLDAATNILYHDDNIIAELTARKVYDPNPRTEITIWEINGEKE